MIMTAPAHAAPALPEGIAVTPQLRKAYGHMKRFGEWYLASAEFRAEAEADPAAAASRHGLDLDEAQTRALLRRDLLTERADLTGVPAEVAGFREYRRAAFLRAHRWRSVGTGADPRLHAWRQRQIARCEIEFGLATGSQIVHGPVAVELQKGCSVGCWFCGVSAPALDGVLRYTPENARLWAEVVTVLHGVCGAALASGILYWASDPLDNPDYERYLAGWEERVGYTPQTTTAQPAKHLDRTRAFVARSCGERAGSMRISVLSLPVLRKLFATFSPEELLDTELVMQMPTANTHLARAGRAVTGPPKRGSERIEADDEGATKTIACISGFLINLVDRSVRMITPCPASEEWPDGYQVLGSGSFTGAADLRALLDKLIAGNTASGLTGDARLRFRPALRYVPAFEGFDLHTPTHRLRFRSSAGLATIGAAVSADREPRVADVLASCAADGVPPDQALATLDMLDGHGVFADQPRPAVP
jgi:radical SAM family RiPP maturation amino acid epimerase